jgi:hypothetical protein
MSRPGYSVTKRQKTVVWTLRACAMVLIVIAFVMTTRNFCELA